MTTTLIQRLREYGCCNIRKEAADALEQQAAQDAINRKNIDLLVGIVNQKVDEIEQWAAQIAEKDAEITRMKVEVEALRADAERYRWLRAQDDDDFVFAVVKNCHFDVYASPEDLDAAIDAALRQEQPVGEGEK